MGCGCGDGDDVIKTAAAGRNSSNKPKEREGEEGGGEVNQSGPDKSIGILLNAVNHFSSCM